jgi:hypothetical protein
MKKPMQAADASPSAAAFVQKGGSVPAPSSEDWALDCLKRILNAQIEEIYMKPSTTKATVRRRARDARTVGELVNTLSKLDAVEKRREGKGRKAYPRDDSTVREDFIRRLDQLLAARGQGALPGKPDPERS